MSRALRPFGVIALVAALARAADVTGENCGHIPESGQRCSAMLEYVLVVDNSWSLHERYEELSEFMRRVVDSFQLDVQSLGVHGRRSLVLALLLVWLLAVRCFFVWNRLVF